MMWIEWVVNPRSTRDKNYIKTTVYKSNYHRKTDQTFRQPPFKMGKIMKNIRI
jgi:hypothetical protein